MRLRKLFYLDLSNNQFEGPVPSDWVLYMQSLRILYLGHNRLSGQLPDDFSSIGGGRLKQLFIENNNFSGYFPGEGWDDYFMSKYCCPYPGDILWSIYLTTFSLLF